MSNSPACGRHKDGSYYLRATEPDHAEAIQNAAKGLKIDLEHRKGPAKHEGKTGTFSHFHTQDAGHIKAILEKLGEPPAGDAATDGKNGEESPAPAGPTKHIHIHLHDGESAQESPEKTEGEEDEEEGRELQKAHIEKHSRVLANGRVVSVRAYEDSRREAMHKTSLAHNAGLWANRSKSADAHDHAAKMHDEAALAHKDAHELHHRDLTDIGEEHRQLIEDHQAGSAYHREEADRLRKDAEEIHRPTRAIAKAHHAASTRAINGKVVQVKAYDDARASQPRLLEEPKKTRKANPLDSNIEHHRSVANAHTLSANVASHEAKDEESHHAAKDRHYAAASAHLRAAHALIVHGGHDSEHPDVKAHLEKSQAHHDKALEHWKKARGPHDAGRQVTLDEAIAEADKREVKKALGSANAALLTAIQRWNANGDEPGSRHLAPEDVPGATEALAHMAMADALGMAPEEIVQTLFFGTGGNILYQAAMFNMLAEFHEDYRPLAKALHRVETHFRPDKWGHLEHISGYTRNVTDERHQQFAREATAKTVEKLQGLLKDYPAYKAKLDAWQRRKQAGETVGEPPKEPTARVSQNQHIGAIHATASQAQHIWDEQTEAHARDPQFNPPAAQCLQHVAEALVLGTPIIDPTTTTPSRIWLTGANGWQASVAPFWEQKKTFDTTTQAYLVTGYRMEPKRVADMPTHQADPDLRISFKNRPGKDPR